MTNIGFVVLHYMTIEDTVNCVNSILKNVEEAPIVVVDNGSTNDTGWVLSRKYEMIKNISVISLPTNLGFAKGNNVGIKYIQEHYLVEFITVLNNDTLILNENFEETILAEYKESNFACLGPKIITRYGEINSNPVESVVTNRKEATILLIKRIIKLGICYLHMDFLMHNAGEAVKTVGRYNNDMRYENVKLHGACWIFSSQFFKYYKGIDEATFLYFEEDILYTKLRHKNLKTVYNPKICIKHLEDSATNSIAKNSRAKNIFILKNEIKSLRILRNILS